jgi:hypothetical protein
MADLTSAMLAAEGTSQNPYSSAVGTGQFLNGTWLDMIRRHRPDLMAGRSQQQILNLRKDPAMPQLGREMTDAYAAENQSFLKSRGIDPTPGNTYLAHFAGPAGAAALHANPQASAEAVLGSKVIAANPYLRGKSAGDVINWAAGRVGGGEGGAKMPYMTQALNTAGAIPGVTPIAQPVAGTTGALADFGPLPSERRKAMADALLSQSFRTAGSATNPLGALAAMAQAYAGSSLGGRYDDEKAARNRKLAEALAGAPDNDVLTRALFSSGDEDLIRSGIGMKVAAAKTEAPTLTEIYDENGRPQKVLMNARTGAYKLVGGAKTAGGTEDPYGTTAHAWEDAEGKTHVTQLSKAGGRKDVDLPPGAKWLPGVTVKDTGTSLVPIDNKSGKVAGPAIPKDVAGEAAQKKIGEGQARESSRSQGPRLICAAA